MESKGFENNRSRVAPNCPCGKSNKDGKFAPFKGETKYGKCHSCSDVFFPPSDDSNAPITNAKQQYVDPKIVEQSQEIVHNDPFFKYFEGVVGDSEKAQAHLKSMGVGSRNGFTTFWMIDQHGRVCLPKGIKYNEDGTRVQDHNTGVAREKEFNGKNAYYPSLFNGSSIDKGLPIVVVESEKSAAMAQYFFPEYTWVSPGGATALDYDKALPLRGRDVILLYDADKAGREGAIKAFSLLTEKLECNVKDLELTPDRTDGYDIADIINDFSGNEDVMAQVSEKLSEAEKKLSPDKRPEVIRMSKERLKENRRSGKKHKGETTHFHELDPNFLWKKRNVYTFTGLPGAGKSEVTLFLSFLKAKFSNWKFILFVPESLSSNDEGEWTDEVIVDRLAHTYWGITSDIEHIPNMTDAQYDEAIDWVHEHFTIIMPDTLLAKQYDVIRVAEEVNEEFGKHDAIIVDPFNTLDVPQRKDELLDQANRRTIYEAKNWTVRNNMAWIYVTHPGKPMRTKDGGVIKPTLYDIRGGMGFVNGSDVGVIIHRPYYNLPMAPWKEGEIPGTQHPLVEFTVAKLKEKFALGAEEGTVEIFFHKKTNRYQNSYGLSPLDDAYRSNYTPGKDNYGRLPEAPITEEIVLGDERSLIPIKNIQGSLEFKKDEGKFEDQDVESLLDEDDDPPF